MLKKIIDYFFKKKLLKEYYQERAQEIIKEYLKEDKTCIGIYDKDGEIKAIKKLNVI